MMKYGRKGGPKPVEKREIELRIISADDLEDVRRIGKMKCYAEAYIDPKHKVATPVDENGGTNPVWNHKVLLQADDSLLSDVLAAITVEIYSQGHLRDKLVGTTRILISRILEQRDTKPDPNPNPNPNPINCMAVQVWKPSAHPQGILNIWIPPTGKFLLRRLTLPANAKDESDGIENKPDDTDNLSVPVQDMNTPASRVKTPPSSTMVE